MEKIGKYEIIQKIGQGGMGVVYKARDPLIDRIVAIKTIAAQLDAEPQLRVRFLREAQSAGQLAHKNIITIYEMGEERGTAYLVMEFLEGEDLRSKIFRAEKIPLETKLHYMIEVCEGLVHAHENNVVHRDVKPGNIFITRSGQVKILDFGLARVMSSEITKTGVAVGTPNYMSPEQVQGAIVDRRSDIFSTGVVFYELLTYRRPFDGDSYASIIFKIIQDNPQPIDRIDPSFPAELSAIINRALAKDPGERYREISHMQRELLDLLWTLEGTTRISSHRTGWTAPPSTPSSETHPEPESLTVSEEKTRRFPLKVWDHPTDRSSLDPKGGPLVGKRHTRTASSEPYAGHRLWRRTLYIAFTVAALAFGGYFLYFNLRLGPVSTSPAHDSATSMVEPASRTSALPQTEKSVQEARHLLETRKYAEAAQRAQEVLELSPDNREARQILEQSRETMDRVASANRRARALFESGRYDEAMSSLSESLQLSPSDLDAQQLSVQLDQYARRGADQARSEMRQTKSKALEARASELAKSAFDLASGVETDASRLYSAKRFGQSAAKHFEAKELYRQAEMSARAEMDRREAERAASEQELLRSAQRSQAEAARQAYERERFRAVEFNAENRAPERFREATGLAAAAQASWERGEFSAARREFETASATMKQAGEMASGGAQVTREVVREELEEAKRSLQTVKSGISSIDVRAEAEETRARDLERQGKTAEAATAYRAATSLYQAAAQAAQRAETTRQALGRALERYRLSYEAKELEDLKRLWPGMSDTQERAIKEELEIARTIQMDLQIEEVRPSASTASVSCRRTLRIETTDGRRLHSDLRATFTFRLNGGTWLIESIRFEPRR